MRRVGWSFRMFAKLMSVVVSIRSLCVARGCQKRTGRRWIYNTARRKNTDISTRAGRVPVMTVKQFFHIENTRCRHTYAVRNENRGRRVQRFFTRASNEITCPEKRAVRGELSGKSRLPFVPATLSGSQPQRSCRPRSIIKRPPNIRVVKTTATKRSDEDDEKYIT